MQGSLRGRLPAERISVSRVLVWLDWWLFRLWFSGSLRPLITLERTFGPVVAAQIIEIGLAHGRVTRQTPLLLGLRDFWCSGYGFSKHERTRTSNGK